jgi:hypothetical protein
VSERHERATEIAAEEVLLLRGVVGRVLRSAAGRVCGAPLCHTDLAVFRSRAGGGVDHAWVSE